MTRNAFATAPLNHLAPHDRERFRRFGRGPAAAPGFPLVHQAFEHWARKQPHAPAAEHAGRVLSYAELDRRAEHLARLLAAAGVRPGDRVGLFLHRSLPMVVGILATLKAGAAYVPQDARIAPPRQLRHVVDTAGIRVALTTADHRDALAPLGVPLLLDVEDVMATTPPGAAPSARTAPAPSPDTGCYVLFTSGTTGTPNGVEVTHRNVANLLLTSPGDLGIRPGHRVAQILNIAFDMAAWEILGTLANGGTLVLRGPDIAESVRDCHVIIATPTILAGIDPDRTPRVEVVAVAGERCPEALADRWAARAAFWNGCGPTEVTIVNTLHLHLPGRPLTIGTPTPNNTVYVLDRFRRPCAIGEVGEMWAGGDCVSTGYLGNPRLTDERYAPDPFLGGGRRMFRTRDLGRWTEDGRLEPLGRTDDQVKVRGFRVELDSVSAVLETVPGVESAATVKVGDRDLVAFLTGTDVDLALARQALGHSLPYYAIPRELRLLDRLPLTDRGKTDKAALLRMTAAPHRAPARAA
ncbi:amino acid adenylation domain-containing protein [Streptomyces sp. NPDC001941]|uniref:amino acid adenylation domain-containing protein n=1 Tax=Streptomyces sp. NPDC001941 TaxID=3154659 RepID=UPI00333143B1